MSCEEIDDSQEPCLAAGIGGKISAESLIIEELCQDPENLSIIYCRITVKGLFKYTPTSTITYDGISNPLQINDFYIANYKGISPTSFPIDLSCGTQTILLAWDIGKLIPNFVNIKQLTLTVKFIGDNSHFNQYSWFLTNIFNSINPEDTKTLVKGLTPKPYLLQYDETTNKIILQYLNLGDKPCECLIKCVEPSSSETSLTICKDEIQEVTINSSSIVGDPALATLTFTDAIGNISSTSIQALVNMEPLAPSVLWYKTPYHTKVGIYYASINGKKLDPTKLKYQIWKYENNQSNTYLWKDWSSKPWINFYDRDIKPGNTYGYAIRFMGEFGEVSKLSTFTRVSIPSGTSFNWEDTFVNNYYYYDIANPTYDFIRLSYFRSPVNTPKTIVSGHPALILYLGGNFSSVTLLDELGMENSPYQYVMDQGIDVISVSVRVRDSNQHADYDNDGGGVMFPNSHDDAAVAMQFIKGTGISGYFINNNALCVFGRSQGGQLATYVSYRPNVAGWIPYASGYATGNGKFKDVDHRPNYCIAQITCADLKHLDLSNGGQAARYFHSGFLPATSGAWIAGYNGSQFALTGGSMINWLLHPLSSGLNATGVDTIMSWGSYAGVVTDPHIGTEKDWWVSGFTGVGAGGLNMSNYNFSGTPPSPAALVSYDTTTWIVNDSLVTGTNDILRYLFSWFVEKCKSNYYI